MSRVVNPADLEPEQPNDGPNSEPWILDGVEDTVDVLPDPQQAAPPTQAGPAAPVPPQQPTQQGTQYEIRSGTGHIFRGATPEEALANAEKFWNQRNIQQPPTQYQQPPQPQVVQQPAQVRYTKEDWFKTFANDPDAAMELWFERRFGVKPDDLLDRLDSSYSTAVQVQDRIGVADFLAGNPDFPASKESGAMLIQRLSRDGVDVTAWNLEVAYRQLVREGMLVPVQGQTQDQVQQPPAQPGYQQPQPPPFAVPPLRGRGAPPAPPAGGGGGPQSQDRLLSQDEFEALTPAKMRQYLQSPVYQNALARSRGGGGGYPRQ